MNGVKNVANRECVNMLLCDYKTGVPFIYVDYANVTSTEMTASSVAATGGWGAPKRVTFDGERSGTVQLQTQIIPMKLFAMLAGDEVTAVTNVLGREIVKETTATLTVNKTPIVGSVYVYKIDDDCGTPVPMTLSDKTITLDTPGADGDEYIVYYFVALTAGNQTVKFQSKKFPKNYSIRGETLFKAEGSGEMHPMYLNIYKAAPQTDFSLSLSNTGDPTSLSITFNMLADEQGNMIDMTLMDDPD